MSYTELVIKGILVGLGVSVPIGPIGILCINRSIRNGFLSGFYTGIGAVVPNILYTFLAVAGVVKIIQPYIETSELVSIVSGCYIVYLGLRAKNSAGKSAATTDSKNYFQDFLSTFLIMITNPATILSFILVISGLGITSLTESDYTEIFLVTGSIVTGAVIWWITLSFVSTKIGNKLFEGKINLLNNISGIVIILFGLVIIIKSFI